MEEKKAFVEIWASKVNFGHSTFCYCDWAQETSDRVPIAKEQAQLWPHAQEKAQAHMHLHATHMRSITEVRSSTLELWLSAVGLQSSALVRSRQVRGGQTPFSFHIRLYES